jgi:5'-nucleotidase
MERRWVRAATLLTLAMVGIVGLAPAATAAPSQTVDYGGQCVIALNPPNPGAGQQTTVTGSTFPANTSQPILLDGTIELGTANIGADGTFSTVVTMPADLSVGAHTISVACTTTGVSAVNAFNTGPASTVPGTTVSRAGGGVATTGSDSGPKVLLGLAAIAVGAGLVAAASRRRHRLATS